jgi:biopolymer transport protein ExbD
MPMRPDRSSLRRRSLALTSLIDVIFILLLFFLLTSTFTRYGELAVTSAGAGTSAPGETAPILLRLSADRLTLNGEPGALDGLPDALARFRPEDARRVPLLVSLEAGVSAQRLVDALALLRRIGWLSVTVLE